MKNSTNNLSSIQNLSLIFAMEGEGLPLIDRLGIEEIDAGAFSEFGFRDFKGTFGQLSLHISLNGKDRRFNVDNIGTEIASINANRVIDQFKPDLLISSGTAGGFTKHGTEIGDVYFSQGTLSFHDHRIEIPGFKEYGIGNYPTVSLSKLPEILNAKRGILSTGCSLDATKQDLELIKDSGAVVKDMEAAAIARVAEIKLTSFLAIKSVTDFADHPDNHEIFLSHYSLACDKLADTLEKLIKYLAEGRTFGDI